MNHLDEATKEKAQAIIDEAEAELAELGVEQPILGKGDHHGKGKQSDCFTLQPEKVKGETEGE